MAALVFSFATPAGAGDIGTLPARTWVEGQAGVDPRGGTREAEICVFRLDVPGAAYFRTCA